MNLQHPATRTARRVLPHDYGAHPFTLKLARALAERGHELLYLHGGVLHRPRADLELTAKATRARAPMAELSTTWRDRTAGTSRFDLHAWLPRYLRWYIHAWRGPFGSPANSQSSRS